ncbi:tyrosine-type recombinase/integrase [Microvirga sp. 2TAF3]|uniref:tyrosine-type recombinase/integrase n=1 Tax=Microvirga sp. 2TAF3 TaxID=3233014 RepID=UPI003F9A1872
MAVRQAWERLIVRAQLKDLRFHDLRHEAISRFFEYGLSTPEVSLISGHRDLRMLARYTHLRPADIAKKLRSISS